MGRALDRAVHAASAAQESARRVEKLAAVGQIAASVGHDLRSPLGAVRNATYYVKRRIAATDLAGDARVAELLAVIDKELAASTKLVGDLLDFARERAPALAACPVRPLVDDALAVVQRPPEVRVENAVPDALPVPRLDRDQLRQVLVNLIQNAVEAIPAGRGGRVEVRAEATEAGLTVAVSDDGAGIPGEALPHIFEPLYTTKASGTGLGLSICAGIVRRHGGVLDVETGAGAGTTFLVKLPRAAIEAAAAPSDGRGPPPRGSHG